MIGIGEPPTPSPRSSFEDQLDSSVWVPPRGEVAFAFAPRGPSCLKRLVATVLHAGPAQRLRAWRGMNVVSHVTALTQYKRRARAMSCSFVESISVRNVESLLEPVPLAFFLPVAFGLGLDVPPVRPDVMLTVRVRTTGELGYWLRMRCVFVTAKGP